MSSIFELEYTIQPYAWGTHDVLNELFAIPNPDGKPQAEIWMGAHPGAPSTLVSPHGRFPLNAVIAEAPEACLGTAAAQRFHGRLPFLFKVLSAARALSIQAHPAKQRAEEGFAREEAAGLKRNAFNRNYRDDNHKPEMMCALTPFKAMNGFREIHAMLNVFSRLAVPSMEQALSAFQSDPTPAGLKAFYTWLMTLPEKGQEQLVAETVIACGRQTEDPACAFLLELHEQYPGDTGVLAGLMLNVVTLQPGEAMYLTTGVLHAYVEGTGLEIMANSDNVLRGGLTGKHIDVPELLACLRFKPEPIQILKSQPGAQPGEAVYLTPADEFELIVLRGPCRLADEERLSILFCTEGSGILEEADGEQFNLHPGACLVIMAESKGCEIRGEATVYRATVPAFTP